VPSKTTTQITDFSSVGSVGEAALDGEFDEMRTTVNGHASDINNIIRDDKKLKDDVIEGHEFSPAAITYLKALVGNDKGALIHRGTHSDAPGTAYTIGDLAAHPVSGGIYICVFDHTSGASLAADVAETSPALWDGFFNAQAAGLPDGAAANEVLMTDGSTASWELLTNANFAAGAFEPSHGPAFTGNATMVNLTVTGTLQVSGGVTTTETSATISTPTEVALVANAGTISAASSLNSLDFTTATNPTDVVTISLDSSFAVNGHMAEWLFIPDAGEHPITWSLGAATWVGYIPQALRANKAGYLTMRYIGGTTAANLYLFWSEAIT
jgi:hypothetical protein